MNVIKTNVKCAVYGCFRKYDKEAKCIRIHGVQFDEQKRPVPFVSEPILTYQVVNGRGIATSKNCVYLVESSDE